MRYFKPVGLKFGLRFGLVNVLMIVLIIMAISSSVRLIFTFFISIIINNKGVLKYPY